LPNVALSPQRWVQCHLTSCWITTQGVRDAISKVADEAGVKPYLVDGTRGEPGDVTPHALRHSVAYRMMNAEMDDFSEPER